MLNTEHFKSLPSELLTEIYNRLNDSDKRKISKQYYIETINSIIIMGKILVLNL